MASTTQDQTTPGYQPPYTVQFSVFLDMRVGKMLELLKAFHGHDLTVAGLSVLDATDHAVVRVITSRSELARRLLDRAKLPFAEIDVLVAELPRDDDLTDLCITLLNAELNIHYVYPLTVRPRGHACIVIHTDDNTLAGQILRRKQFTLLGENDLGDNATGSDPQNPHPGI